MELLAKRAIYGTLESKMLVFRGLGLGQDFCYIRQLKS